MKNEDANQAGARVVRESTAKEEPLPADVEAAWEQWSAGVGRVDARTMARMLEREEEIVGGRLTDYKLAESVKKKMSLMRRV